VDRDGEIVDLDNARRARLRRAIRPGASLTVDDQLEAVGRMLRTAPEARYYRARGGCRP
jgi:hypothetical protein